MISRSASFVSQEERSKGKPKIKTKLVRLAKPPAGQKRLWGKSESESESKSCCCCLPGLNLPPGAGDFGDTDEERKSFRKRPEEVNWGSGEKIEINVTAETGRRRTGSGNVGCRQSGLLCNVDQVKRNFIALLRYNKLQDFYLGTLIYSVIIVAINFYSTLVMPSPSFHNNNQSEWLSSWNASSSSSSSQRSSLSSNLDGCPFKERNAFANEPLNFQLLLLGSTLLLTFLLTFLGLLSLLVVGNKLDESLPTGREGDKKTMAVQQKQLSKCVGGGGSLATIDEAAASAGEPTSTSGREQFEPRRLLTPAKLNFMVLVTILLALHLPSALLSAAHYRKSLEELQNAVRCQQLDAEQKPPEVGSRRRLPLAAWLLLAYLEPLLLEGSSLNVKLICSLCTLLPLILLCWLDFWFLAGSLEQLVIYLLCLPIVLLMGFQKCSKFTKSITEATFAGASQLIEAKVSLEHQRQQQETLLLSVLPAYVADQVKRNMLKKMNSAPGSASEPITTTTTTTVSYQPDEPATTATTTTTITTTTTTDSALDAAGARSRNSSFLAFRGNGSKHLTASASGGVALGIQQPTIITSCNTQQAPGLQPTSRRGFNELYIRTYNNVSLLYGDIVGFTRLCTQLSSSQLVRVLNELFSLFDHLAEKHKIMRIKILGDCYYGVGGIPEFAVMGAKSRNISRNDNHAINCVNMGLDMIHYIRCLNVERTSSCNSSSFSQQAGSGTNQSTRSTGSALNLCPVGNQQTVNNIMSSSSCPSGELDRPTSGSLLAPGSPLPAFELNMRIGIHTGHIHSGVIGLKKWQFDVWSNDVSVAMHCESSGTAGRVHVTEATIQQLNGAFTYEPSESCKRDTFFAERDIKTYLICESIQSKQALESAAELAQVSADANQDNQQQRNSREPFSGNNSTRKRQLANRKQKQQIQTAKRLNAPASLDSVDTVQQAISSPSNLDEDKIRAATIGTIRQTLLPGSDCFEPVNCRVGPLSGTGSAEEPPLPMGASSYGLAFGHPDMKPLSLDFRDATIGKLYKNTPIERLLQELFLLLLLLTILLSSIDYLYLSELSKLSKITSYNIINWRRLITIMAILVTFFLVTILLIKQGNSKKASSSSRSISGDHSNRIFRGPLFSPPAADYECNFFGNFQTTTSGRFENQQQQQHIQVITDKTFSRVRGPFRRKFVSLLAQFGEFRRKLAKKLNKNNLSRTRIKTMLATSAFCTVIAIQVYLIYSAFCLSGEAGEAPSPTRPSTGSGIDNKVISIEQYQLTVILLLVSIDSSSNLLSYRLKCCLIIVLMGLQVLFLFKIGGDYYSRKWFELWPSAGLILIASFWSLSFARQMDYTNKVNFLWRNKLSVDHEELEYISGVNKVLLENILPSHVVQYYLSHPNEQPKATTSPQNQVRMSFSNIRNLNCNNELYHEQHDNVAVMFASIPHFYEFYDESNISKQGLGCIALLNEIICDFDKLLLKNKFSRIEKIKTIGSTYMAAAGLRPCHLTASRNSTVSQFNLSPAGSGRARASATTTNQQQLLKPTSSPSNASSLQINMLLNEHPTGTSDDRKLVMGQQKLNLICMIQFASSLMNALNAINKQSFQVFKLRVGVNTGPVIAGVIGAQRPFYDIWGDCVNIASRMESLGEIGRIQVEEKTARLLMESLCSESYSFVCRGPIDVKGKGGMVTYFVDKKPADFEQPATVALERQQQQQNQKETTNQSVGG